MRLQPMPCEAELGLAGRAVDAAAFGMDRAGRVGGDLLGERAQRARTDAMSMEAAGGDAEARAIVRTWWLALCRS